jgi:hypothetical protein
VRISHPVPELIHSISLFSRIKMKSITLFLLTAMAAWAGESLTASATATLSTFNSANPYRIETMWHGWTSPAGNARPFGLIAAGEDCRVGDGIFSCNLSTYYTGLSGADPIFNLNTDGSTSYWMRYQHDPTNKQVSVELWNLSGAIVYSVTRTYTSVGTWGSNASFRSGAGIGAVAFARVHSTLKPLGSRIPTTFDNTDRLYEWKFDGNLTASAGGVNASGSGTYIPTPDQVAYSIPKVRPTTWATWTTLRAGDPSETLTGSDSYSQADASASVNCVWQITSRPTDAPMPTLSSHTTCDPTISGLLFGQYTAQLFVTDTGGSTSTASITFGAAAMDSNGVIVDPDWVPFTGEQIAYGRNPWGYADYQNYQAYTLRKAAHEALVPPLWETWKAGTVSYRRNSLSTTLNGGITSTATSITVTDASQYDLTGLPGTPMVLVNDAFSPTEAIRICSVSGNVLTVCYDGRGWNRTTATAWSNGQTLHQVQILGSGTSFLTEVCPAGVGPSGTVAYSTGTISLTPGSATVSLTGANWSNLGGRILRVSATHSGGTPFVFVASLTSGNASTGTLARAYPASADTQTNVTYALLNSTRDIQVEYTHPTIPTGGASPLESATYSLDVSSCESDTRVYAFGWISAMNGVTESALQYTANDGTWLSDLGPNFYDEVLSQYSFYRRSGLTDARDAARLLGDRWLWQPGLNAGYYASFPRRMSITGSVANLQLDSHGQSAQGWNVLRRVADVGAGAAAKPCEDDVRETAYEMSWVALMALYDPVGANRTARTTEVGASYTRDNNCKGADNNHPQIYAQTNTSASFGVYVATGVTLTNGSANATSFASAFVSGVCPESAYGVLSATNGSPTLTWVSGANFVSGGGAVVIWGARSGQPAYYSYTFTSGTQITIPYNFIGTTGNYTYQILPDNSLGFYG